MTKPGDFRHGRGRRALVPVATMLLVAAASPAGATTSTPSPTPTCVELTPATAVFTHIDVDPPRPVVGDTVYIDFGVCLENGGGGVFFYFIDGTEPLLAGETSMAGNSIFGIRCDESRFELQAVATGDAGLRIRASYETAIGCIDRPAFVFLQSASDVIEIEVGTGTPQPTRTPTVTPTFTQSRTPTASHTPSPTNHPSVTAKHTATATPSPPAPCPGDCDGDREVTVDEVVTLVAVALGEESAGSCAAGDLDGDARITVDEVLRAVAALLDSCPMPGAVCGGIAGIVCPPGEACDARDPSCAIIDLAGRCVPSSDVCPLIFLPVCACDGSSYANDCERIKAGAVWAHDGVCGEEPN